MTVTKKSSAARHVQMEYIVDEVIPDFKNHKAVITMNKKKRRERESASEKTD